MNHKDIYYFLGSCLILDHYPDLRSTLTEIMGKRGFSWELFVQVGSNHLILPALYRRFCSANILHLVPDDLVPYLKEIYELNDDRNSRIISQIHWINSTLGKSGILPVFIKGAGALLEDLYSHPADRMMADIDCLIPGQKSDEAASIIIESGYSTGSFRTTDLPFMHHFPTLHKPGEADIDLHMDTVEKRYTQHLDGWENRTRVKTANNNSAIHLLSRTDRVRLNFLHGQMQDHGQYFANVSLRNAYELYLMLADEDVSEAIRMSAGNLRGYFNNYLALISKLFYPFQAKGFFSSRTSVLYISRLDKNKTSRFYNRFSKTVRTIILQLSHYLNIGFKAIFKSEYRLYLYSRLRDPHWYGSHLSTIRDRFK